jgi:hypothetical protein
MIDVWYYSHNDRKVGPCSGRQLKELADSGQIVPTDTIWREGIERSVFAHRVKNLFARPDMVPNLSNLANSNEPTSLQASADVLPSKNLPSANLSESLVLLGQSVVNAKDQMACETLEEAMASIKSESSSIPGDLELRSIEEVSPMKPTGGYHPRPGGKARATAGKGAIIVGQDGTNVQFRKKCTTCGHEDTCRSRMPIKQGTTKVGFYCSKCRKRREVEILGIAQ